MANKSEIALQRFVWVIILRPWVALMYVMGFVTAQQIPQGDENINAWIPRE